ncbi:hypothetical protein BFP97_15100 [Roseivirga sp. 4D4]|nr:hypothetical protein BFP97_15100 [Roseivirga sp. 4D4]
MQAQENQPFLDQKVTYRLEGQTIVDVLKTLESNHEGLVFVYSSSAFDLQQKVSGGFRHVTLRVLLKEIFKGVKVDFQEKGSKVIIRPKKRDKPKGQTAAKEGSEVKKVELRSKPRVRPVQEKKVDTTTIRGSKEVEQQSKVLVAQEEIQTASNESTTLVSSLDTNIHVIRNEKYLSFEKRTFSSPRLNFPETAIDSSYLESKKRKRTLAKEQKALKRLQRQEERQNEEKKFRAYATSYTGLTQVGGKSGIQMGGSLVWLKNRRWGFGLSGYAVQRAVENDQVLSNDYRLAGGYGGFFVEYTPRPSDKIHLSFPILIGGGGVAYMQQVDRGLNLGNALIEDSQAFAVIEPGVAVEANLLKFIRVGASLSYRYTTDTTLNYQSNSDQIAAGSALNSLSFGVVVKLGIF